MRRTVPWAALAFYPLFALPVFSVLDNGITACFAALADISDLGAFFAKYWWVLFIVTVILQGAVFVWSAVRNRALPSWRRILWSAAILLVGPIVIPAYWWLHSERRSPAKA